MMRRGEISATTTVGDVLRWLADRRESGGLFVEGPAGSSGGAAYLVDGDIAFVTTGHGLPMEQQFLASGVLTREQLPAVMDQVRAGRDLAFVLDGEPGVEFRGVVQVIHDRSVEALGQLLGLVSGSYLLDRYQQHPFGMLGHWSATAMLELADRKFRLDRLDPAATKLLGQVPEPTANLDEDSDLVLAPVELRFLLESRDGRALEEVANHAHIEVIAAAQLAKRLGERGLLRFAAGPSAGEAVESLERTAPAAPTAPGAELDREAGLIASA